MFGRKRCFPHIKSSNFGMKIQSQRQAFNFLIQGTAADILKNAVVYTAGVLNSAGLAAKVILLIHDEIVWEVQKIWKMAKFKYVYPHLFFLVLLFASGFLGLTATFTLYRYSICGYVMAGCALLSCISGLFNLCFSSSLRFSVISLIFAFSSALLSFFLMVQYLVGYETLIHAEFARSRFSWEDITYCSLGAVNFWVCAFSIGFSYLSTRQEFRKIKHPHDPGAPGETPEHGEYHEPGVIPAPGKYHEPGEILGPGEYHEPGVIIEPGEIPGPGEYHEPREIHEPGKYNKP